MAEALLLEYASNEDLDVRAVYQAVLDELGLGETGPEGSISHVAALAETGEFVIFELWESRVAQEKFFAEKLGPAFAKTNAPAPSRMTWFEVISEITT